MALYGKYEQIKSNLRSIGFDEISERDVELEELFEIPAVCTEFRYGTKYRIGIFVERFWIEPDKPDIFYVADTSGIPIVFKYINDSICEIQLGEIQDRTCHQSTDPLDISLCKLFKDEQIPCYDFDADIDRFYSDER